MARGGTQTFNGAGFSRFGGHFIGSTGTVNAVGSFFALSGGTFTAPSGLLTIPGNTAFGGLANVFEHNFGTVRYVGGGGSSAAGTKTFYNLEIDFDASNDVVNLFGTDYFIVLSTFTITTGGYLDVVVEARGDVVIGPSAGTSNSSSLIFGGSSGSGKLNQTFDLTGAESIFNKNVTILKPEGTVTLLSEFNMDNSGQDLNITSGTFFLDGSTLTVNDELVIGSSGTLQLRGFEPLSAGTTVFFDSSTVHYSGYYDAVGDTITITNYFPTYYHLIVNATHTVEDVFQLAEGATVYGDLTIQDGILSLDGNDILVNGAFENTNSGTLRLQGGETTTLTQDTNSGTWEYVGDGDGTPETFTIKDFGGTDYRTLRINDFHATKDVFSLSSNLSSAFSFQIDGGTFDANGFDTSYFSATINDGRYLAQGGSMSGLGISISGGEFVGSTGTINSGYNQSGGTFTATSSTWTVNGQHWIQTGGVFNHNNGTIRFEGVSSLDWDVNGSETFNNVTVAHVLGTTLYEREIQPGDTVIIEGLLDLSTGYIGLDGLIEARGNVVVRSGFNTSDTNMLPIIFSGSSLSGLATQTVDLSGAEGRLNGNITINKPEGEVTLLSSLVMDHVFQTDLTITSGTLNLNGQSLDLVSDWTVSNASGNFTANGGTVTFITASGSSSTLTGSTTFYGLRGLSSGTTLYFASGTTFYATSMVEFANLSLLSTQNNATWYFNYSGSSSTIDNISVQDSNASLGQKMIAIGSNDRGNNTNWQFGDEGERYWISSSESNWNNTANWSVASGGPPGASVPSSSHSVTFDANGAGNANLDLNTVQVTTLTFAGYTGTFDTNSYDITVSSYFSQDNGTILLGTSVVTMSGDLIRTGGTFDAGTSTLQFTGAGDHTLTAGGTSFHHVVVNKTSGSTVTYTSTLDINGDLTLASGKFTGNGVLSLNIAGDWSKTNGDFVGSVTTVEFDGGGASTLSGSNTFYSLRNLQPGSTVYFTPGTTQYISQAMAFTNSSLLSVTLGSTWYLYNGMTDFGGINSTVTVQDSHGLNATFTADFNSTDGGNNTNWIFSPFDPTRIEVDPGEGYDISDTRWGDYDSDGDLDVLVVGLDRSFNRQLRVYKNTGGAFDPTPINVPGAANQGLDNAMAAWGDYDNDGDLDIVVAGNDGARQLRVYRYDGSDTYTGFDVEGAANLGLYLGSVEWGDYDNDGDLDILILGAESFNSNRQIRVYRNNGDGTFDPNQIEVPGAANQGLDDGSAVFGDYDNDGDLDVLAVGAVALLGAEELRIYINQGDGTFNSIPVNVAGVNNGYYEADVAWGDYDNDGFLDILVAGRDNSDNLRLRVFRNLHNGSFDTPLDIGVGISNGAVAWGDFDNDGLLDIAAIGDAGEDLYLYKNLGGGSFSSRILMSGTDDGNVTFGDYDNDNDLDILISGRDSLNYLFVYKNFTSERGNSNVNPNAPGTLNSEFTFSGTGISTAAFLWTSGTDTESPTVSLNYDIQIATNSDFRVRFVAPGLATGTAMFSNYLRMATGTFTAGDRHFMYLKSTEPWVTSTSTSNYALQTDTTYYFRVMTVDQSLGISAPSSNGTVVTAVSPNAIVNLTALPLGSTHQIDLAWSAPGDDENQGQIDNGTFRIFYSTSVAEITGITAGTSPNGALFRINVATSGVNDGDTQGYTVSNLSDDTTYYFRMFTGDEVPNWSTISNAATSYTDAANPDSGARYWISAGAGLWSTVGNWSLESGGASSGDVPNSTHTVIFDGGSVQVSTMDVNFAGVIDTLHIDPNYTGIIYFSTGIAVSSFTQHGARVEGGTHTIDINGEFSVLGGTYSASTNNMFVSDDFTVTGGTFVHNSSTVTFDSTGDRTVDASNTLFNHVIVSLNAASTNLTVATGTVIPLGDAPRSTGTINNYGVVTAGTGGLVSVGGLNNYGLFSTSLTSIDLNGGLFGLLFNSSGSTITMTGQTINIEGISFLIELGSFFPENIDLTLDGTNNTNLISSGTVFNSITLNKNDGTDRVFQLSDIWTREFIGTTGQWDENVGPVFTLHVSSGFSFNGAAYGGDYNRLEFIGDADQDMYLGPSLGLFNSPVTINKDAGTVTLLSELDMSNPGLDLFITSGTFFLDGSTLTVNDELVVGSSGTLQLRGFEPLSAGTTVFFDSSTVHYSGYYDAVGDTITITNYFPTYYHLIINSTGTADDTFQLAAGATVYGDLNITDGILSLDGNDILVSGTFENNNNGTLRLQGGETTTLTQDTDSGRWEYVGDGDGTSEIFTIKDFGAGNDYYWLDINDYHVTADTFTLSSELRTAQILWIYNGKFASETSSVTVTNAVGSLVVFGGIFEHASSSITAPIISIAGGEFRGGTGNVEQSGFIYQFQITGGTFTAPSGNLIVVGIFNLTSGGGIFNHNNGTVVANHPSTQNWEFPGEVNFYNFTVSNGVGLTTSNDTFIVDGTFRLETGHISDGDSTYVLRGDAVIETASTSNFSPIRFEGNAQQSFDLTGVESVYNGEITISKSGGRVRLLSDLDMDDASSDLFISTGTLDLNGFNLSVDGGGATLLVQNNGDLRLRGHEVVTTNANYPELQTGSFVTYDGTGTYNITNFTTYYHHVVFTATGATQGTFRVPVALDIAGDLTVSSGTLDTLTSTVTFTTPSGSSSTLTGSATFYGLRGLSSGTTLYFASGTTFFATSMVEFANLSLLSTQNNATWYFNYSGSSSTLVNLSVQDSNASLGQTMIAIGSNDLGNNTNWQFGDEGERYWISSGESNWNNTANWSVASGGPPGASVPSSSHSVTFDANGAGNANLDLNTVQVTTLTFAGYTGTFDTNSYDITVSSYFSQDNGVILLGTSVVTMSGDLIRTGGTFDAGTSTIQFTGNGDRTLTPGSTGFYHMIVNKVDGSTLTLGDALDVNGDLSLQSGLFAGSNRLITLTGNWDKAGGTFTHASTFRFDTSGTSRLTGSTTFYNLYSLTAGATLQFEAGTTFYATNIISFNDATLRSATDGATWYLSFTGLLNNSNSIDVQDSNASLGQLIPADFESVDLGNNTNWFFSFINPTEVTLDGTSGGLENGSLAWGDLEGDGDLDLLVNGWDNSNPQIRIYPNNGDGTISETEIPVDQVNDGLYNGQASWGDFDNDGDLDILVNGNDSSNIRQIHVYRNEGGGTINATPIKVAANNEGLRWNGSAWGDYDNDGDLDVLAAGIDSGGSNEQIHIYSNNGDGTFDQNPVLVESVNGGLRDGDVEFADFDNDGDLDVGIIGNDGATYRLRVYRNNGDGSFNQTEINVDPTDDGLRQSDMAWGDFDNDGDLDILATGVNNGVSDDVVRVYRNNGNGTFDENQLDLGGTGAIADGGEGVAWGDMDGDGDLDAVIGGNGKFFMFDNNGDGTFGDATIYLDPPGANLGSGKLALADIDGDGDLDIALNGDALGNPQIRIYTSSAAQRGLINTNPNAPGTLNSEFTFSATGISTAAFLWTSGTDTESPTVSLNYDIQISTNSDFAAPFVVPGLATGTAMFSNYLRMATGTFTAGDRHFMYLKSTEPWVTVTSTANYALQTDSTYYFRVFTVDQGLAMSGASSNGSLITAVSPNAIVNLTALPLGSTHQIDLAWSAPGDDENQGQIDGGTFRIFYSTSVAEITGITAGTSPNAALFRINVATSGVNDGDTQGYTISNLQDDTTYYFRMFTGDEVPNWSTVSNGATSYTDSNNPDSGARYWIAAGAGNWSTIGNWSLESGGSSSGDIPLSTHSVVFDGGSVQVSTMDVNFAGVISSMTVESAYTGTVYFSTGLVVSSFTQVGGRVEGGTHTMTLNGNFNLTGGTFVAPSNNFQLSGDWLRHQNGNFVHNSGTVTVVGSSSSIVLPWNFATETFNNLVINKDDKNSFTSNTGIGSTYVVEGTLTLQDGWVGAIITTSGFDARGDVLHFGTFDGGAQSVAAAYTVQITGTASRTITFAVPGFLPQIVLNAENVTVNTSGTGVLEWNGTGIGGQDILTITTGTFNQGSAELLLGEINQSGGQFNGSADNITLDRVGLDLSGGDFTSTQGELSVNYFFDTRGTGNFSHNTGTVTFINTVGPGQIQGSATFYALSALTDGATIQFEAGSTNYVTSMVNFSDVRLESTSSNATWYFVYSGSSQTLNNVEVQDSNAGIENGKAMVALGSTDLGNNTNWIFSDPGVRYWIAPSAGLWSTVGNWSLASNGPSSNDIPTSVNEAIFDDGSVQVSTMDVNFAGVIATMTVSSGYTGTIYFSTGLVTNAYTQADGVVEGGTHTIDLNGNFTMTGGTFTSTSGDMQISGDWDSFTGGDFVHNNGTMTFVGSSSTWRVRFTEDYYNVVINKDHANSLTELGLNTFYVNGTLALEDGTLQSNSGSGTLSALGDLIHSGDFDGSPGTLRLLVNVNGSATRSVTFAVPGKLPRMEFNAPNATYNTAGAGLLEWVSGSHQILLSTGTFNQGLAELQLGTLRVSDGVFNGGSANISITGNGFDLDGGDFVSTSGDLIVNSLFDTDGTGTFDHNTGTVTLVNPTAVTILGSATFYALRALTSGGTVQFTAGTTQYVTNMVNFSDVRLESTVTNATWYFVYSGSSQTLLNLQVQDSNAGIEGGLLMDAGSDSTDLGNNTNWDFTDGVVDNGLRYWIAAGPSNWNIVGNWSLTSGGASSGDVPLSTHSVVFDSGSTSSATVNVNITVATMSIGGFTAEVDFNGFAVIISSAFVQLSGKVDFAASTVTVQGDFTRSGGFFTADTSSVVFTGSKNQSLDQGTTNFYHMVINKGGGILTLGGDLDVDGSLTLVDGVFDVSANNYPIFQSANLDLSGGAFIARAGTVTFDGNGGGFGITQGASNFYHIAVTRTGGGQPNMATDLTLDGDLSFVNERINAFNRNINIGGSLFDSIDATIFNSTVTFTGTSLHRLTGNTTFHTLRALSAGATLQFAAGTTHYVTSKVEWSNIGVRSSLDNSTWYFVYTGSSQTLSNLQVQDSNAGVLGGDQMLAPGSTDLGNNTNWIFNFVPPAGLAYTTGTTNSLTAAWNAVSYNTDSYTLQISSENTFPALTTQSSNTATTSASIGSLLVNTTYYAQVNSIVNGSSSAWSSFITTATLADVPETQTSTWTAVNITSVTIQWRRGNNPALVTLYEVELSTSQFRDVVFTSSLTYALSADLIGLSAATTYYAQVRAINHSGIPTGYTVLGSTRTQDIAPPSNFRYTASGINNLTAAWDAAVPPGDSYTLQISSENTFPANTTQSSNTALLSGNISGLIINTTYYAQVNSLINGSSSPWASFITTATLTDVPVTAVSTWTAVNLTSITIQWTAGINIANTLYEVELSTSQFFDGTDSSSRTYNLDATFTGLTTDTTYYGQVRSINHSDIPSTYVFLGSTKTLAVVGQNLTWQGNTSNWEDPNNWSPAQVPTAIDNITIPDTSNDPLLVSISQVRDVTLNSGASLFIQGATFTVTGTINSSGHLVLSSSEVLTFPGGVWDVDSGSVTYAGTGGLTAGGTYYDLYFNNAPGVWTLSEPLIVNRHLIRLNGTFTAGTQPVELTGNGDLQGFTGSSAFYDLSLAAPAVTTTLLSDIDVTGTITFDTGIVAESGGSRNLTAASAEETPFNFNAATTLNITTLTWVTSHSTPTLPVFDDYPVLVLNSGVAGGSEFLLGGDVTLSTVAVYSVGAATHTAFNQNGNYLQASNLILGVGTANGNGDWNVGTGVLTVQDSLIFRHAASLFDAGTSTGVAIGGDFFNEGSTGTINVVNSTMTFFGNGRQYINSMAQTMGSVYSANTSASGITFISSLTAVNFGVTGLSASATVYFQAGSTVSISNDFALVGSAGDLVVLRSTQAGVQFMLDVTTGRVTADYVDVQDSNATGSPEIYATNSVDQGNNINWDFDAPAASTLVAAPGSAPRVIQISWDAPADDGSTGLPLWGEYRLQHSTDSGVTWSTASAQIVISTSGVTPGQTVGTTLGSVSFGVTYYFRLRSVDNLSRWSPYSNVAQTFIDDTYWPAAITNLAAARTSNEGEIRLSWTAPDQDQGAQIGEPVAYYLIRHSTTSVGDLANNTTNWWNQATVETSTPVPSLPGVTDTVDLTMAHFGATYYFGIRSVDAAGNLSPIDTETATPGMQANDWSLDLIPPAVTNFAGTPGDTTVTLNWSSSTISDFYRYEIYRSSISAVTLTLYSTTGVQTTNAFVDNGLDNGNTYYYRVEVFDQGTPDFLGVALSSTTEIISVVPSEPAPNVPVINPDHSVGLSTETIRWGWSIITPPTVNGFRFFGNTVNISGDLPNSATSYIQTGLQPNEAVSGVVQAFNGSGTTDSSAVTRYALANPPVNTTVTGVNNVSISLSWGGNNNQGTPTYQVQYSQQSDMSNSSTINVTTTNATVPNLQASTQYYLRVRAFNGNNIPTAYDVIVTTTTEGGPDGNRPGGVGGLRGSAGGSSSAAGGSASAFNISLNWDPVVANDDGTEITDLAGYVISTGTSWLMPEEAWTGNVFTQTSVTVELSETDYVAVRAVDTSGNQSVDSAILRVADLKFIVLADDRLSRLEYSLGMADQLSASAKPGSSIVSKSSVENESYYIKGNEVISHYANGRIIKSVRFGVYGVSNNEVVTNAIFNEDATEIFINYSVTNDQIVQGTPSRLSYFQSLSASGGFGAKSFNGGEPLQAQDLTNIGTPVVDHINIDRRLSGFWFNGVKWVKLGGTVDSSNQMLTLKSARLGFYQLRQATQLGDLSLVQVYPRIITPNGDGANDVVIFQFGEADLTGRALTGEIFDITGAKVASLKPGPDPASTLIWDGKTDNGASVPSGIYIYQLKVDGETVNGTVVVAK